MSTLIRRLGQMRLAPPMPDCIPNHSALSIAMKLPVAPGSKRDGGHSKTSAKFHFALVSRFTPRRRWLFFYALLIEQIRSLNEGLADAVIDHLKPFHCIVEPARYVRTMCRRWPGLGVQEEVEEAIWQEFNPYGTPEQQTDDLLSDVFNPLMRAWLFDNHDLKCKQYWQRLWHETRNTPFMRMLARPDYVTGLGIRRFALQFFDIPGFNKDMRTASAVALADQIYAGDTSLIHPFTDEVEAAGFGADVDLFHSVEFLRAAPHLYRRGMTLIDKCLSYPFKP